jgi:surfeit locus 1 family protein
MADARRRFPIALTVATLFVAAICSALGVWQLQRAAWKAHELARIAALRAARPQPIDGVLARVSRGEDVSFTRVTVRCASARPIPYSTFRYSIWNNETAWRPIALCHLSDGPFDALLVDRGFAESLKGVMAPLPTTYPELAEVTGVLIPEDTEPLDVSSPFQIDRQVVTVQRLDTFAMRFIAEQAGVTHLAPVLLVAEHETPPVSGVSPAPPVADAPANLQYVGAYAPTWFGLAGAAAAVYAAMLRRRLRPKA